jgi:DNA invertase Pin-like site-specific DNA recombinase
VFVDRVSGRLSDNPELQKTLDYMRPGDVLVVTRLARLTNSIRNLVELAERFDKLQLNFRSLHEPHIDTTTSVGRALYHWFGVLAELNREFISEQTKDGLAAARARGRVGGRKRKMTPDKIKIAIEMYESNKYTMKQIGAAISVNPRTIYRYLPSEGKIDAE